MIGKSHVAHVKKTACISRGKGVSSCFRQTHIFSLCTGTESSNMGISASTIGGRKEMVESAIYTFNANFRALGR